MGNYVPTSEYTWGYDRPTIMVKFVLDMNTVATRPDASLGGDIRALAEANAIRLLNLEPESTRAQNYGRNKKKCQEMFAKYSEQYGLDPKYLHGIPKNAELDLYDAWNWYCISAYGSRKMYKDAIWKQVQYRAGSHSTVKMIYLTDLGLRANKDRKLSDIIKWHSVMGVSSQVITRIKGMTVKATQDFRKVKDKETSKGKPNANYDKNWYNKIRWQEVEDNMKAFYDLETECSLLYSLEDMVTQYRVQLAAQRTLWIPGMSGQKFFADCGVVWGAADHFNGGTFQTMTTKRLNHADESNMRADIAEMEQMESLLRSHGKAWFVEMPQNASETNVGSDQSKYYLKGDKTRQDGSKSVRLQMKQTIQRSKDLEYRYELMQAYNSLLFYMRNSEEFPMRSDYMVCECGHPYSVEATECYNCGDEKTPLVLLDTRDIDQIWADEDAEADVKDIMLSDAII